MIQRRLLFTLTCVLGAGVAHAQSTVVLFDDPDLVMTSGMTSDNVIINAGVDASVLTSDPTRTAVGEFIFTGAARFVNGNSGLLPINAGNVGQTFEISLDYFVPVDTTLDDNSPDGSSGDNFFLQVNFNGVNSGSIGFIGAGAAGSGWQTLTLSGEVPATVFDATIPGSNPTADIAAFIVAVDGGFAAAGSPNGNGMGTAFFVDNFRVEVGFVPEPATLSMIGLAAMAVLAPRRARR